MPVIGITGGIATGKSAASARLRELLPAAKFFDADHAARELTARDVETQALIRAAFGAAIYSAAGDLNRDRLRTIVFADPEKKVALEQILHPRIRRQWALEAQSRRDPTELFFADIPLLYETGGELLCDRVLVVACTRPVQLRRLMARSSLSESAAVQMISAQMPLNEKMARADHIIWNNDGPEALAAQAEILARTFPAR
ncbi:MAG: dephospho-CoA kinase [Verrucomicrobiota bacterium]|nr:dephospho-CoA kinase [Verrucomicrobiota bacterium]